MDDQNAPDRQIPVRALIGFTIYLLLNPALLFLSAGTLRWGMAWLYFGISILGGVLSRVMAHRANPGLLAERARYTQAEDTRSWDRLLVPVSALYGPIAAVILAGLDRRYGWTDLVPTWGQALALLVGVAGFGLAAWAMVVNPFFSAVVRIQAERGHTVCDSGPYRYIRHPGYAGGILWYLITPLALNAMWAAIPMAASILATLVRTGLEDRTLQEELPGYQDYTRRTPYRLLPGIW